MAAQDAAFVPKVTIVPRATRLFRLPEMVRKDDFPPVGALLKHGAFMKAMLHGAGRIAENDLSDRFFTLLIAGAEEDLGRREAEPPAIGFRLPLEAGAVHAFARVGMKQSIGGSPILLGKGFKVCRDDFASAGPGWRGLASARRERAADDRQEQEPVRHVVLGVHG